MFWGVQLKENFPKDLSKTGKVLHISHAILDLNLNRNDSNKVFVTIESKKTMIAQLDFQNNQFDIDLDLTTTSRPVFSMTGPGCVYLLGYFEPAEIKRRVVISDSSEDLAVIPKKINKIR